MSLLRREASLEAFLTITGRSTRAGTRTSVSNQRAMQHSVVWGATRLRADIVSLMPVDTYRSVGGVSVATPTPPILVTPSQVADGQPMSIGEWMGSTQTSLDRTGNVVGIIKSVDGNGLPTRIDPVDPDRVSFRCKGSQIVQYLVEGEKVDSKYIWHERQYTVAGIPFGLSPIQHAALQLTAGLSAQEWAVNWFESGATPSAHLKNEKKVLAPGEATNIRDQYAATQHAGIPFVSGVDWSYTPMAAKAAESQFLEQMHYTDTDLCRFLGVPADMLDVVTGTSGTVTYANITQRNLQLLVMNLGGAIKRREDALSRLLAQPRYVKLNRSAVLAMDALTRAQVQGQRITNRTMTPDEARELEDQLPLTEEQYAQFDRLWPVRSNQPTTANPQGGQ